MFHVPENNRIKNHPLLSSSILDGNNGAFAIKLDNETLAYVIASDGMGWEHVSVHMVTEKGQRTPVWSEMCRIKDIFWDEEDCVVQFHPPKSRYVNNHEHTLHLWRKVKSDFPMPPTIMVGIK